MIAAPSRVTEAGNRTRLTGLSGHIVTAPGLSGPGAALISMFDSVLSDTVLWASMLTRLRSELAALPGAEREWLAGQVARIALLQRQHDELFRAVGGPAVCTDCLGGCCSHGKHHVTLGNLLGFLLAGEEPPAPDFARTCPFLGASGCRVPVDRRPFNCVIFFCEAIDARCDAGQRARLASIEATLRAAYQAIADRCPGASLRGLLIGAARLGDRPLLSRSDRP